MSNLLKNFPISELAQEFLREFGWSPERSVDLEATYPELFRKISADKQYLNLLSNIPKLKPLLKNLSGIKITECKREIFFGMESYDCYYDTTICGIKILNEKTGMKFIVFGTFVQEDGTWFRLMIDKSKLDFYAIPEEWRYMIEIGDVQKTIDILIFDDPSLMNCKQIDLENANISRRIEP